MPGAAIRHGHLEAPPLPGCERHFSTVGRLPSERRSAALLRAAARGGAAPHLAEVRACRGKPITEPQPKPGASVQSL